MHFKLLIAFVSDEKTEEVMQSARKAGATGITVINRARGEGIRPQKTFLGLDLEIQRDVLLLLVEEHLAREVLEQISIAAALESESGAGIACQIDVEDVIGLATQAKTLTKMIEDKL